MYRYIRPFHSASARQAMMKLCKFLEFPDSLEKGTASTTSSFGEKVLAFASDILAELPQPAAPMVTQTCLIREMVRYMQASYINHQLYQF